MVRLNPTARRASCLCLALALLAAAACDDSGDIVADAGPSAGDGDKSTSCGPNLEPYKTACVPVLDDCPGDQVPVPGGGCKRIGVEACSIDGVAGLKGPPDWTCKRVGVQLCSVDGGPGILGPPDWTCVAIGPPRTCLAGWALVEGGWCEPILPQAGCPANTMEVIGHSTCQPVGDCGTKKWGKIKTTAATVFVDQSYKAKGDGSQAKPFATIGQAIAAAPAGGHVAVAAGTYTEDLVVDQQRTVEGRCPQLVTVKGQLSGVYGAAATLGDDATLRGLTVTGQGVGIRIFFGKATVKNVVVQGAAGGVQIDFDAEATLQRVLVSNCSDFGVRVIGARATLRGCTVRDTLRGEDYFAGDAVVALRDWSGVPSQLTVKDSVFLDNWGAGIEAQSSSAQVERSVVMGSQKKDAADVWKSGIKTVCEHHPCGLVLRDALVAENRNHGLDLLSADTVVERSVIRDTLPRLYGDSAGNGLGIGAQTYYGPATLVVRDSLLTRNHGSNVWLSKHKALVERTVLSDARPNAQTDWSGYGINASSKDSVPSSLTLRECLVTGNRVAGVNVGGSQATVQRSVVQKTLGANTDGCWGCGIFAYYNEAPATLLVQDSLVHDNRTMGIGGAHAAVEVQRTVVRDTWPEPTGYWGYGIAGLLFADPRLSPPRGNITVTDCILPGNSGGGVYGLDVDLAVQRTLVTGTRPSGPVGQEYAQSITIGAMTPESASLTVEDSTVTHVWGHGIVNLSALATVKRTVVRSTRSIRPRGQPALGIVASPWWQQDDENNLITMGPTTGSLTARDTLVEDVEHMGVALWYATGTLERVAVRNTRPTTEEGGEPLGVGIFAGVPAPIPGYPERIGGSSLALRDSVIQGCSHAGLLVWSASADVRGTLVRQTSETVEGYGDGIAAATVEGNDQTRLFLEDSLVEDSARAGLLLANSTGAVKRSVLRRGTFSVVLEQGADPMISESNVFEENTEDRISFGVGLAAPPAPYLPPTPPMPE